MTGEFNIFREKYTASLNLLFTKMFSLQTRKNIVKCPKPVILFQMREASLDNLSWNEESFSGSLIQQFMQKRK